MRMVTVVVGSMGMPMGTIVGMAVAVTSPASMGMSVAMLEGIDSYEVYY